ncbi:MAG: hypothetical protein Q7S53_02680 [bacterium]|nr:hypothetical protein [bacterium]
MPLLLLIPIGLGLLRVIEFLTGDYFWGTPQPRGKGWGKGKRKFTPGIKDSQKTD